MSQIRDLEQERQWSDALRNLLDDHKDVVTQLAEGFSECRKYVSVSTEIPSSFICYFVLFCVLFIVTFLFYCLALVCISFTGFQHYLQATYKNYNIILCTAECLKNLYVKLFSITVL